MPVIEYEVPLDDEAREWFRFRAVTGRGQVLGFVAQYETTIEGERIAVIRYDTAHGRAHRDQLDRRGREIDKIWLPADVGYKGALEIARRDLGDNWPAYKRAFLGEDA